MKNDKRKRIAIIGTGKIGLALATLWQRKEHDICLGSRDPAKAQAVVANADLSVSVKSIQTAVSENDIIVLAVPYTAIEEVIAEIKDMASGKVIIDATNPFGISDEGIVISTLGTNITAGSRLASLLPNSMVVRAFTHVMDELLVSRGTNQPGFFAVAIAGDNLAAKQTVSALVHDAGFTPLDIGTLAESGPLDPGGVLFPKVTAADMKLQLKQASITKSR